MSDGLVRSIVASDGYQLHFRYRPVPQPRGAVVVLHGIQSHAAWYDYSSAALAQAGYAVYFADRRGSGLNAQDRGHADHGERLLNDVRQLLQVVRREQPATGAHARPLPLTLVGISWGGKTAAAVAAAVPDAVQRLVLLYPGLAPRLRPTRWQQLRLWLAREMDVRRRLVPIPLNDPALFTSSSAWQDFIRQDPLALHAVTTGFLNAGRDLDQLIARCAPQITQPVLLMLAGRDQIIENAATARLVTAFGTSHLTIIKYPEARHTLEFEPDRDVYVRDLLRWLNSEIG